MPITSERDQSLRAQLLELFERLPERRTVYGVDYAMDDPGLAVIEEASLKFDDGQRLRIAVTAEAARPPFEWLIELSSDIGVSDYFKHYLVRDSDTVLAQRKVLTVIDEAEAAIIEADLALARQALSSL